LYLIEIYKSIQGESSFAGMPCIFVRLAGCNLRCAWCDSEYTFTGGYKMNEDQVAAEIEKLAPVKLIEFTGGEPMLQERELVPLMERLLRGGYELMIETSGERPLERVPAAVHKIVDVKCPGSGEAGSFRMSNLECLTDRDEVKFVIANRGDYEFARDFIREHKLETRAGQVLLSPAFSKAPSTDRTTENCLLDPRELVGLDAGPTLCLRG
jgi:7-carboxy-7-deazaguanine synthase